MHPDHGQGRGKPRAVKTDVAGNGEVGRGLRSVEADTEWSQDDMMLPYLVPSP